MKDLKIYIKDLYIYEKLNLKNIPTDSSLEHPKEYEGEPKFNKYKYFGDCKNTVDKDHMWDATQMSNWINDKCKVTSPLYVLNKLQDGDRKFPKNAQKIIAKLQKENKLEDTSKIVCA